MQLPGDLVGGAPLAPASGDYELDLMANVTSSQAWGVSAVAHRGKQVAVKNGWLSRSALGGRWIVNSVGRVTGTSTDLRLAVLSRGHDAMAEGVDRVEDIATLVRRSLAV